MSRKWPKIFRDPIHDMIVFEDNPCDQLLLKLIDCKEVQRLRRIKQLGFTDLVFPAANHSRFAHSLGVLHVARKFLDHLSALSEKKLSPETRRLVLAASLVHDSGHGPFSHAFEEVTGRHHEHWTLEIILNETTEVNRRLREVDPALPEQIAEFFKEKPEEDSSTSLPRYLTHVVSSQLDADRCDYLLRDSYATGTNYGRYDLSWILAQLRLKSDGKRFFVSRKGISAAEAYLFARFHMYRTVYFHKTTRAAEVMLRVLFGRYKELLTSATSDGERANVVPGAPRHLAAAFSGSIGLEDYLALDDHTISWFLQTCSGSSDVILRTVSSGLLHRRLFKAVDVSGRSSPHVAQFYSDALARLPSGWIPKYSFVVDTPKDTPYKPYDPDSKKPNTQIYVENAAGEDQEISTLSPTVEQLRRQYELVRYYFPDELRGRMAEVEKTTFRSKT